MLKRLPYSPTQPQTLDLKRLSALIREKLKRKILKRELPRLVALAIIKKLTARQQLRYQSAFLRANEPIIEAYRRRLVQRFNELEKTILGNMGKSKRSIGKHARRKDGFNVNQWLTDRASWQAALTEDGYHFTGQGLDLGGNSQLEHMGAGVSFDQTDPRAIAWVQQNAKNAAFAITNTQYEALRLTLMEGIADGDTIADLRKRLMAKMDIARKRAELIARTETLKASNRGSLLGMSQSGVVQGKQWLAAFDRRTCPSCAQMDGQTMGPLDKPFFEQGAVMNFNSPGQEFFDEGGTMPEGGVDIKFDYEEIQHPPLHPDCRCTILAVFYEGALPALTISRMSSAAFRTSLQRVGLSADATRKVDGQIYAAVNKQLQNLQSQYNTTLKNIRFAQLNGTHIGEANNVTIFFNIEYTGNYKEWVKQVADAIKNRTMANVAASKIDLYVTTHEFAHTLWRLDGFKTPVANAFKKELNMLWRQYKKKIKTYVEGDSFVVAEYEKMIISRYSTTNMDEFFAEAFTDYKIGKAADPMSKQVGELAAKYFGKE